MRKLQINESGAWRMVITYPEDRALDVHVPAVQMVKAANPGAKIRILDEQGHVLMYWEAELGW